MGQSCNHCYSVNVISRLLHNICVFVCSPICPESNAHAPPLSVACPAHNSFPHYLIKGMIFGKKVIEHKMGVLIFSTNLVRTISHYNKK